MAKKRRRRDSAQDPAAPHGGSEDSAAREAAGAEESAPQTEATEQVAAQEEREALAPGYEYVDDATAQTATGQPTEPMVSLNDELFGPQLPDDPEATAQRRRWAVASGSVSYTHLTMPTLSSVSIPVVS
ncbi:hypothetical protein SA13R_07590, partial [Rothia kristinae]|uniref:hypothetical protein n=1 Tax=Rothia kristinae TaxID=37923 RepID=UPI0007364221